jgi:hypothetical protein
MPSAFEPLRKILEDRPDHMLVTKDFIAVLLPVPDESDTLLVIPGEFEGLSEEEVNLHLQYVLRKMML